MIKINDIKYSGAIDYSDYNLFVLFVFKALVIMMIYKTN